jgi:uncharacterized protein (TIGR02996 family)
MKRPARLPASPDDLAEWMVYADWLQGEGDPRGEVIAHALTGAAAGVIHDHAGIDVVTRLGFIHSVVVPRDTSYSVASDELHRTAALVGSDDAALLEELEVPLEPQWVDDMQRVFAALPVTCRRVAVDLCNPITDDAAGALLEALPGHVREVALSSSGIRLRIVGLTGLARWIDDRFDAVELRYTRSTWDMALQQLAADRDVIARRLAATMRVRLQLTIADTPYPVDRVDIGRPGDAAIVDVNRRCAMALSTRTSDRGSSGGIRSKFAVGLYRNRGPVITAGWGAIILRRDGDDWSLENDWSSNAPVRVDGVEVAKRATIAIHDGARISSDDWAYVLITRDVTPRVRALLG